MYRIKVGGYKMGKFNLGEATTLINENMSDVELYVDSASARVLQEDIERQLELIQGSLNSINTLMNQAVAGGAVEGSYADAFKGWAKKCSSQAITAKEKEDSFKIKYSTDVKQYTMDLLDSRIAELENQIASITD